MFCCSENGVPLKTDGEDDETFNFNRPRGGQALNIPNKVVSKGCTDYVLNVEFFNHLNLFGYSTVFLI